MTMRVEVNGRSVEIADEDASLLDVLRDQLRLTSVKDGCSPQGQCGCCTVLVDGQARVSCVTPARRVEGRSVVTMEGIDPQTRARWSETVCEVGASQCGFCTPGILLRLEALRATHPAAGEAEVGKALAAHLCRCTGWRTLFEAFALVASDEDADRDPLRGAPRDLRSASARATIEGRATQHVDAAVALGEAGFADDTCPPDALVAVSDGRGGWAVAETMREARARSGKVQGRRSTAAVIPPLALPAGAWDVRLQTSWVDPAYLETDASWCAPGAEPVSPLANGGAFGAKVHSSVGEVARALADEHGRTVRVRLSREEAVQLGPKRPPIAAGLRADGTGLIRVVRTRGIVERILEVLPDVEVEEVDVAGPCTSTDLRAAGWAEAIVLRSALPGAPARVHHPEGGWAEASFDEDGTVRVRVGAGDPLDDAVLRSYCIGAAHMAMSWVSSEGLSVDDAGEVQDLTVRSLGVLRAMDTPPVEVSIERSTSPPVNGSDAVFAAVAAALWARQGRPPAWPTAVGVRA